MSTVTYSKKQFLGGFFVLFFLTICASTTMAADIYVNNPAELQSAMDWGGSAQPGDTVILKDGVWTDVGRVRFGQSGASGNRITVRSETPGGVMFTGDSRLDIWSWFLVMEGIVFEDISIDYQYAVLIRSSYVRITGCVFDNLTRNTHGNKRLTYLRTRWESQYLEVDHNAFINKEPGVDERYSGAQLLRLDHEPGHSNYHHIHHNYFADIEQGPPSPTAGPNGFETIRIGTSGDHDGEPMVIIENNLFERANGEIEIISLKTSGNTIRYNTFDASQGAVVLRAGSDTKVHGNFFIGRGIPGTAGVRIIGTGHRVYNNYFEGLRRPDNPEVRGSLSWTALSLAQGIEYENNDSCVHSTYQRVQDVVVAFNTFVDVESAFEINWQGSSLRTERDSCPDGVYPLTIFPPEAHIANNVISTRTSLDKFLFLEWPSDTPPYVSETVTFENNIVHNGGRLGFDGKRPSGIIVRNPRLTQSAVGQMLRPVEKNSPLIGAATDENNLLWFVDDDIDGQFRPVVEPATIGADEVSMDLPTQAPLSALDVGTLIGPPGYIPDIHTLDGIVGACMEEKEKAGMCMGVGDDDELNECLERILRECQRDYMTD